MPATKTVTKADADAYIAKVRAMKSSSGTLPVTFTDVKEKVKADLQKIADTIVTELEESQSKGLWKMAEHFKTVTQFHGYNRNVALLMYKESYCKLYNIPWDGKGYNKNYNSFTTILARVALVGSLSDKVYHELFMSGRSFTSVWTELAGNSKSTKKIISKDTKEAMDKAHLTRLAKDGVTNADEYAKGYEDSSPKPGDRKEVKSSMEYIAPDTDKEWMKYGRQMVKNDPKLFVKFLVSCARFNLISEKVISLVKKELKVS